MDKFFTVAQVVVPIFVTIFLGMFARKKQLMTPEEIRGLQQFVMKFALPCVLFNSCLTAKIGVDSLSSMAMVLPLMLGSCVWAFRSRERFGCHNFPMLFAAQESGMLGIPLFMILFGADQAYRMGVLDLTQAVVAVPTIALLTADTGENPSAASIAKKVASSPFLIMSLLGLFLNLSGIARWMDRVGVGAIVTETTSFLSQPVSAMMIFSVGYNFSLERESRKQVLRISAIHFGLFLVACAVIQGLLCLIPGVDDLTRWAMVLYCTLPASYLAPGLGKNQRDFAVASGVCSVLTVVSLAAFCLIAVLAV